MVLILVALASASSRITAVVRPRRRPRSNAVRTGVVAGIPRTVDTSSSRNSSRWITMPSTGLPLRRYSSVG